MLLLVLLMLQLDGAAGSCPDFEDGCSRYFNQSFSLPNLFFLSLPSTSQLFLPVTRSQVLPPLVSSRYWRCLQLVGYPTQPYFYFLARITSPFLLFFFSQYFPPTSSLWDQFRETKINVCMSCLACCSRTTHDASFGAARAHVYTVGVCVLKCRTCSSCWSKMSESRRWWVAVSSLHEVWMRWLQCQDTLHSARPFPRCFLARACRDASIFIFFIISVGTTGVCWSRSCACTREIVFSQEKEFFFKFSFCHQKPTRLWTVDTRIFF